MTIPTSPASEKAWITVVGSAMPLVVVLGFLSLLIATLTTVGIFLRLRPPA